MLSPNHRSKAVHRTVACRAETENLNPGLEAWEFTCPYCDYRAIYRKLSPSMAELEVWCEGDPLVRHHNSYASELKEESWLTPEIRQQMESLLADVEID